MQQLKWQYCSGKLITAKVLCSAADASTKPPALSSARFFRCKAVQQHLSCCELAVQIKLGGPGRPKARRWARLLNEASWPEVLRRWVAVHMLYWGAIQRGADGNLACQLGAAPSWLSMPCTLVGMCSVHR